MTKTKKITILVVVGILAVGLLVAVVHAQGMRHSKYCQRIEIHLEGNSGHLLTVKDVQKFVKDRHLDPSGVACDSIDIAKIESELEGMPLVDDAECCILKNGTLEVKIKQKCPFFHVRTNVSDYCIDVNGRQMITPKNLPDTMIRVSGDVTVAFAMEHIYPLVKYMYSESGLTKEFRRISVGSGNQINLYSNLYPYYLVIAGNDRYEPAFEKFMKFRKWDKEGKYQNRYKSINLQFRGQIVCKLKPTNS
ncbi:MAG: hypothetical protein MJ002_08680 [Paludibacteraceae bacterium]|nr:hypothetical protein [Paludibacteraceae bacterium]